MILRTSANPQTEYPSAGDRLARCLTVVAKGVSSFSYVATRPQRCPLRYHLMAMKGNRKNMTFTPFMNVIT